MRSDEATIPGEGVAPDAGRWQEANQLYLSAALAELAGRLAGPSGAEEGGEAEPAEADGVELGELRAAMAAPPALDRLAAAFDLSSFERDLLLWCAGVELESSFARIGAERNPTGRPEPTFGLALLALPEAHWSALSPGGPLRRWRLLSLEGGGPLTQRPLRVDERVLHYLAGVQYLDERLAGIVEPAPWLGEPVESQAGLAEVIARALRAAQPLPAVQLTGTDGQGKVCLATAVAADLGLDLAVLRASAVPTAPAELDGLRCLWEREAALMGSALLLDCEDLDEGESPQAAAVARFADTVSGLLFVATRSPRRPGYRPVLTYGVEAPHPREQETLWLRALGPSAEGLNGSLQSLVAHFRLSTPMLANAARQALAEAAPAAGEDGESSEGMSDLPSALWRACRHQCRPRIDHLAQRIDSIAGWDDLVLPDAQKETLRDLVAQVRHRYQVYEDWGFAAKSSRGLGVSALFSGVSGTGKTLAAEVLARELDLDLYRIDLSSVISKYIGETEKNLRRVFDAAEHGGAVLLFDEADALFGKRSEVKDSHDRYANVEISYLLQRMEAYRGLAILTTNMKSALDPAFQRRLRFIVEFPFPDAAQRRQIWEGIFPPETPLHRLDLGKLSRLNVAGGSIRNIALAACFNAAEAGTAVGMAQLLQAARAEYRKLEKPLGEAEIRGWVQ